MDATILKADRIKDDGVTTGPVLMLIHGCDERIGCRNASDSRSGTCRAGQRDRGQRNAGRVDRDAFDGRHGFARINPIGKNLKRQGPITAGRDRVGDDCVWSSRGTGLQLLLLALLLERTGGVQRRNSSSW